MVKDSKPPTLTDARGMGGVIALEGFDYQLWDGLVRLPSWLANPTFEQLIFEGLEDLEARFFAPQTPHGHLLERFQAKAGSLSPSEVREVFQSFLKFGTAYPLTSRNHTLVTPRMPTTLAWLARDPARVRNARPFYAPFPDIIGTSDAGLREDMRQAFGESLGDFINDAVEVSERNLPDLGSAVAQFDSELSEAFPTLDVPRRRATDAFSALSELARRSIGIPLSANTLARTIEDALGDKLPLPTVYPLHVRSNRNQADAGALQLDASAFSGEPNGYLEGLDWKPLAEALDTTSSWLRAHAKSRVRINGSYRLTTAMILGYTLRAANGFELEIMTKSGVWATDDRPSSTDAAVPWTLEEPIKLHGDSLMVAIGILRDPAADVLRIDGVDRNSLLCLHLPQPLTSAKQVQSSVAIIKNAVDSAKQRLRPKSIELYVAGPAAFAVALGHRWNAMGPTLCHEYISPDQRYVATANL